LSPDHLKDFIKVGVRVVVPFGPRTIQGYVMDIQQQPSEDVNILLTQKYVLKYDNDSTIYLIE
jgi:primosomal protein N'